MASLSARVKKILPARKKPAGRAPVDGKRSFRLRSRRERPQNVPKLASTRRLLVETLRFVRAEWKILSWLGLLYAISYRVLVEGLMNLDIAAMKQTLQEQGLDNKLVEMSALTATAFGATGGTATSQSGTFAGLLAIFFGLAIIWVVRKRLAGHEVRVRDALYNCAGPLLPVLAVLSIIFLQLLPAALGWFLYIGAMSGGIIVSGAENMSLFLVAVLGTVLSCYWISSSFVALVAVTVPGMYPLAALRGAKELVSFRRRHVFMRVVIFMILATLFAILVIMLMVSNSATQLVAAEIVDILRGFLMVASIVFLYKLYRTLLDETAE